MKIARQIAITLLIITAVSAIYGSYYFITDPTGNTIGYSLQEIKSSPFKDFLVPGWLLLIFLGIGSVVSMGLTMQEEENYSNYIMGQGAICMIWVLAQIVMLQHFSVLQVLFVGIGSALIYTGNRIKNVESDYQQYNM